MNEQTKDSGGREKEKAPFFFSPESVIKSIPFSIILRNHFRISGHTITRLCDKIKRILDNLNITGIFLPEGRLLVMGKAKGQAGRF